MRREVETLGNAVLDGVGRLSGRAQERRRLPSDVLESDEAFLVVFDAPDVDIEDVQVRFTDTTVHVRIDRTRTHRAGFEMRFPGRGLTLDGRVSLPAGATVDPEKAIARLTDDGVLTIELPKGGNEDGPIRIPTDESADSTRNTDTGADTTIDPRNTDAGR